MVAKAVFSTMDALKENIRAARGQIPCDLVIKGARYLDVFSGAFLTGDVAVHKGQIVGTGEEYQGLKTFNADGKYLVPGFIDSHVHIESSMMVPARFQQSVLPFGTTSVIWDPHEIANVKGSEGIRWALEASEGLSLDIFVMVPSCVPSTSSQLGFETSGAELLAAQLEPFKDHPRVLGLAEMMNFPGLLNGIDEVVEKIHGFQNLKRDGHCPGLLGKDLNAYGVAGIHSCHESTTLAEATEKMQKGLHVLIREGSCAKDADALLPMINAYSSAVLMLCSDDRNPLDIRNEGHISYIINLALKKGIDPTHIFRAASYSAAKAFGLEDRGVIAPGYLADLVLVESFGPDLSSGFRIDKVWKSGEEVDYAKLKQEADRLAESISTNNLKLADVSEESFFIPCKDGEQARVRVIEVIPGKIVTKSTEATLKSSLARGVQSDLSADILKMAVFERHHGTGRSSVAFVKGFGLTKGAIATSINHDSHNVIVVGANDLAMTAAVNRLRKIDGGIVVTDGSGHFVELRLPLGGLMTAEDPDFVADRLVQLKSLTKELGCKLEEPFLTLSFLALPVIPELKLTDRGLIDVSKFEMVSVLVD